MYGSYKVDENINSVRDLILSKFDEHKKHDMIGYRPIVEGKL